MRHLVFDANGQLTKYTLDGIAQPLTLSRKAGNLARAGGRVFKAAVKREEIVVSTEEKERRLAICQSCNFFDGRSCEKCGCVARWKTKLATESCPIQKW